MLAEEGVGVRDRARELGEVLIGAAREVRTNRVLSVEERARLLMPVVHSEAPRRSHLCKGRSSHHRSSSSAKRYRLA